MVTVDTIGGGALGRVVGGAGGVYLISGTGERERERERERGGRGCSNGVNNESQHVICEVLY